MASQTYLDLAFRMIALGGSGALTGAIAWISYGVIPAICLAPSAIAQSQFLVIFTQGKTAALTIAGVTSLTYAALAYRTSGSQHESHKPVLYATAAALTISILPYTLTAMADVNGQLLGAETPKGDAVKVLLGRWGGLNYGRAVMTLIAGALGMFATLS